MSNASGAESWQDRKLYGDRESLTRHDRLQPLVDAEAIPSQSLDEDRVQCREAGIPDEIIHQMQEIVSPQTISAGIRSGAHHP